MEPMLRWYSGLEVGSVKSLHTIFNYMLYSIPMDLQHESKLKRLRIVYLPSAIVVGFKNLDFQTLYLFFRWCFF